MTDWADLEGSLAPTPDFLVEAPDGKRDWSELARQTTLFRLVHLRGPRILAYPIPNAGKRNPLTARREGIMAGVFDTRFEWQAPLTAVIELKGYDKRGRPGVLSLPQIEYGNRMVELGHHAACFFCPHNAVEWLRTLGFPVMERVA